MLAYTEPVSNRNTFELQEGDILSHHGAILVLKNRREHPGTRDSGPVVVFHSDVVTYGVLPRHWCEPGKGWIIQGNELAYWSVCNR